jgi:hypothetical protein
VSGIFISYRQDDSKPWAVLLRDTLAETFGDEHVFLDKDALHAGNWRDQLHAALDRTGVVLVVIGQRWLSTTDAAGRRRLWNDDDVHRQEIAIALARPAITVIPVRVDQATLPQPEDLPADLRALLDRQSREISDSKLRRQVDLQLLTEDIERATGLTARRKPSPVAAGLGGRARAAIVAVLCVATIAAGWLAWRGWRANQTPSAVDISFHPPEPSPDPPVNTPPGPTTERRSAPPAPAASPAVVRTSLPTAVETRTNWGERQMAEDRIDPERVVTYEARLENGISRITFDVPYLARLQNGGPIAGLNYLGSPFKWRFPELSIRAVNNTSGTMVISEARFEVIASRIIATPVITVEDLSVDKLVFHNEGWGEIVNPSMVLAISESGQDGSVSLFAPASHTVRIKSFSDSASIPLSDYVPDRLRSSTLVAVEGQIEYGEPGQRHTIAFRTRVSLQVRSAVGIPPSHFYDLTLRAGESGIVRQVPLAQEMKAGESDHFVVRVGADRSSTNRVRVSFRTVDGTVFEGGQLAIDIFVPRSSGKIAPAATAVR